MSHRRRGLALIFNHYVFDTVTSREGTEKDCADITEVLRDLRFDVKIYNDLKYGKLYEVLSESKYLILVVLFKKVFINIKFVCSFNVGPFGC